MGWGSTEGLCKSGRCSILKDSNSLVEFQSSSAVQFKTLRVLKFWKRHSWLLGRSAWKIKQSMQRKILTCWSSIFICSFFTLFNSAALNARKHKHVKVTHTIWSNVREESDETVAVYLSASWPPWLPAPRPVPPVSTSIRSWLPIEPFLKHDGI